MTIDTNTQVVPPKRIEPETPAEVHDTHDPQPAEHKKVERIADRAAHKANKTEQNYDESQKSFTI